MGVIRAAAQLALVSLLACAEEEAGGVLAIGPAPTQESSVDAGGDSSADAGRVPPIIGGGRPDAADRPAPPPRDAGPEPPPPPPVIEGETIGEHVAHTCFNEGDDTPDELLDGLSPQLVRAINCVQPGTLGDLPDGNWQMLDPRRPALLDARAIDDLVAATREREPPLVIRWAYRDVALQHLFYLWTLDGCDYAARPGQSNHQDGLAVDLDRPGEWRDAMRRHGWEDNLPNDRPHFDYVRAEDLGLGPLSLVAFQALWNLNVPDRALALSGIYDAATAEALSDSPLRGFPLSLCEDEAGRPPPTVGQAAWNGCDVPPSLVEALSAQIAEVLQCAAPGSLASLDVCADAGCVVINGPPKPEWLEARTYDAVVAASRRVGGPIPLDWGWRDPATGWFLRSAWERHRCGDPVGPAEHPLGEGRALRLAPGAPRAVADALVAEGFRWDAGAAVYRFDGGADLRALGVLAFQRLWNANHPGEPLATDGRLGPTTRAALDRAPPGGFERIPCERGGPEPGPVPVACVPGCLNQGCPGRYEFCHDRYGACEEVPCDADLDCEGLEACDDPDRGASETFYCDAGRCRRR